MAWQGKGMGAAWERHAMCESAFSHTFSHIQSVTISIQYVGFPVTSKDKNAAAVNYLLRHVLANTACPREFKPSAKVVN